MNEMKPTERPESEPQQRPFNPEALSAYAGDEIKARVGGGATAYRFTVFVPIEEVRPEKKPKATLDDTTNLEEMLVKDFDGCTKLPISPGYGLRKAHQPPEMNINIGYVVYTPPVSQATRYFQALQTELQEALVEECILVEQQNVTLV